MKHLRSKSTNLNNCLLLLHFLLPGGEGVFPLVPLNEITLSCVGFSTVLTTHQQNNKRSFIREGEGEGWVLLKE